ncbi:MAG: 4-(cytidine 5'-diphospho)-2-C-methyl-D-erythritol kinase [Chlamydiales bacterium]|nr:4-(cytidine 5'-diphospho)-2-C-methyl-D-erythritol kinase [Chlamydiales bacterium]
MKLALFSPAKINLFFRVLKKRPDGYHEIASLYQSISLGDRLEIELAHEDRLECDDETLPCDSTNLILRAADLFRRKTGKKVYAHFHLLKRTPIQAGLGGGSSNAATALWGLNQLSGKAVSNEELMLWSAELGSDVPFFFSTGTAYCEGRGEKILPLPPLPKRQKFWIAKPQGGLSTPLVYQETKPELLEERDPKTALRSFTEGSPLYFNDLEPAAFRLASPLSSFKNQLYKAGFDQVVMTGSGTAFICFGEGRAPPEMEGVRFFSAHFLQKREEEWYEFPSFC